MELYTAGFFKIKNPVEAGIFQNRSAAQMKRFSMLVVLKILVIFHAGLHFPSIELKFYVFKGNAE